MSGLANESPDLLLRDLLDSDIHYFEAGAVLETFIGGTIVWMPGLEMLAAGCVVQRIKPEQIDDETGKWLQNIESRLVAHKCQRARLYLQHRAPDLEKALLYRGYRPVDEVALIMPANSSVAQEVCANHVILRQIRAEKDWMVKHGIHQQISIGPDGHVSPASEWVEMERRKCNAGYMTPYLIFTGKDVCGSVNVAVTGNIVRLKNLVIHPAYRGRGIGRIVAAQFAGLAVKHGKPAAGCFALDNATSLKMYQQAGFLPVSHQTEWVMELNKS